MIVPMKKIKLFFIDESKDKVLKQIQTHALIMPDSKHQKQVNPDETLIRVSKSIEHLEKYLKKKNYGSNEVVTSDEFNEINESTVLLVNEILYNLDQLVNIDNKLNDLKKELLQVSNYKDLSVSTSNFTNLKYLDTYIGKINKDKKDQLLGQVQSLNVYYDIVNEKDDLVYIAFAVLKEESNLLLEILNASNFTIDSLNIYDERNNDVILKINNDVSKLSDEKEMLNKYFTEKTLDLGKLKLLYDQLSSKEMREQVSFLNTKETLYLEGWIRTDQVELLEKVLSDEKIENEIELRDPLPDEYVPTALKNNAFVKPFENITNQFSIPSASEIDPNPIMSFWYWIIFGIMMGDIGYGLSMIIMFGLLLKFGNLRGGIKDLVKVFLYSGFTAVLAGAAFGSMFGITLYKPLLDPINDPMPMLIISIGIGIVHVLCALVMKLIATIRAKDVLSGLNDAVSWILILVGISLLAVSIALPLPAIINTIALVLIVLGALIIVLLNGRNKTSIGGKVVSAFTGLYNSTSYLSDILSYSRILALALSSGVIAMTFNLLGEMVWGIPFVGFIFGILIYLVGHIFNFVMGLLSAYVHAGRLQYLEFYGKFFEGGGYLYEPLQPKLKYVYQINLKKEVK